MEFDLKGGIYIWSHTLREGNRIADFLVNHGLTLNGQCCVFYFQRGYCTTKRLKFIKITNFDKVHSPLTILSFNLIIFNQ